MRIAVIGVGAVGGYFGGRLALAGHDVVFVARGETLERLRSDGLRAASIQGDFHLERPSTAASVAEIEAADVILPAVKAWQVQRLAEELEQDWPAGAVVVPLQNGVEASYRFRDALGAERVLGGFCRVFASRVGPAEIAHHAFDPTILCGELGAPNGERVERLREALAETPGMKVLTPDDIEVGIWMKCLFVTPLGAVGAAARSAAGVMRSIPETRRLLEGAMTEVVAVGRARGVDLPEDAVDQAMAGVDKLPGETTASMHRDLVDGRPSELDAQLGAIVRLGAEAGVATPFSEALMGALVPLEREARAASS